MNRQNDSVQHRELPFFLYLSVPDHFWRFGFLTLRRCTSRIRSRKLHANGQNRFSFNWPVFVKTFAVRISTAETLICFAWKQAMPFTYISTVYFTIVSISSFFMTNELRNITKSLQKRFERCRCVRRSKVLSEEKNTPPSSERRIEACLGDVILGGGTAERQQQDS